MPTGVIADRRLSQTLPAAWSALTHLQYASLNNNQLTGVLPMAFQQLQQLQRLDLSYNQFRSTVPAEWQSGTPNMAALTRLVLTENPNM